MKTHRDLSLQNLLTSFKRSILCLPLLVATASADETRTIAGTANIYGAGHAAPPPAGFGGSGTLPPGFGFPAGPGKTLSIVSATGTVTLDKVTNNAGIGPSGPDGNAFYAPTDVTSTGGLSGIKANVTGFLAGVFLTASEPVGGGPPVLDFTTAGRGTNFSNLAPQIGQVFFIGNGQNSLGGTQQFSVPATATRLFVGIVDAADGDNAAGPPQAYGDNGGAFTATMRIEPKVTRLCYLRYNNVHLMNADGTAKTNLTNSLFYAEHCALDSEGKYIVFRGSRGAPGPGGVTLMGVWVMKAEPVSATNAPVLVTNNLNYGYNFSWHPDGEYLAMGHYVNNKPQVTVLRVRNASGAITPESSGNPAVQMTLGTDGDFYSGANFSPDGRYLGMSCKGRQIAVLRAFDTAGTLTPESATNPVAKLGTLNPLFTCGTPEWSPDGKRLVFPQVQSDDANLTNPRSMLATLAVRNAAGALTPEALTNPRVRITTPMTGSYSTASPSWSADGSLIAFEEAPNELLAGNVNTIRADAPENALTNPRVPLTLSAEGGGEAPRFAAARIVEQAAVPKFTLALFGLQNGQLLPPNTSVSLRADPTPSQIPGVTISRVQFHVNGKPAGSPDTVSPFNYNTKVVSPGLQVVTAVATDSLGRTVTSPPLSFTVTPAGAGQIALQTEISPAGTSFAPGQLVTYTFVATNTSKTAIAKGVKINAPVPDDTKFNNARAYDEKGNPLNPRPEVAANDKQVVFNLGDIPVGKTRRAELKVRVPFDARVGGKPIRNSRISINGIGFGDQPFSGNFEVVSRDIVGSPPSNSPRLVLLKTVVDRLGDSKDVLDIVEDSELGLVPGLAYGETITILLYANNFGKLPAERVLVKDRIPEGFQFVTGSARIGEKSAGALFKIDGRSLLFQFGDFEKNEAIVISYQLKLLDRSAGGPAIDSIVNSVGAEISSRSLRRGLNSSPEKMPIRVLPPVALTWGPHLALPGISEVGKPVTYTLAYSNAGKRLAKDIYLLAKLPEGTNFKSAKVPQSTQQSFRELANGDVLFNLGDIAPETDGKIQLVVNVTSKASRLPKNEHTLQTIPYQGDPTAPSPRSTAVESAKLLAVDSAFLGYDQFETNRVAGDNVPRLGLFVHAPMSVQERGGLRYVFTIMNYSNVKVPIAKLQFTLPSFTKFSNSSVGEMEANRQFVGFVNNLAPNSAQAVAVTLECSGKAWERIELVDANVVTSSISKTTAEPTVTLIIEGNASDPSTQMAIASAQLTAIGADACVALTSPDLLQGVSKIGDKSQSFKIGGIDYIQCTNGCVIFPIGKGKLVAAGDASLIGNDGSTLIGNDGSTLVAAGAGNLIRFNGLVGNDGASLVGQDGSTIMAKLYGAKEGNLVAAGAGNLVAAGGGNLVGNDGASLIGNDGSTISFAKLVAAGGGNLVAAGAGNLGGPQGLGLISAAGNVLLTNQVALFAIKGGSFVAAGGGYLKLPNGKAILSSDSSRAAALGKNGTFISGGGGNPLVAAGRGN